MKRLLLHFGLAASVVVAALVSCSQPVDVDGETIFNREAIDLLAQGQAFEEQGNYRMALERYGKALDLAPRPAVYYHIGSCYYALGEHAKAQDFLTEAVRLAGDYPAAQYMLSKVRSQLAVASLQTAPAGETAATTAALPVARPTLDLPPVEPRAVAMAPDRTPAIAAVRTQVAAATPAPTPVPAPGPAPAPVPAAPQPQAQTPPKPQPQTPAPAQPVPLPEIQPEPKAAAQAPDVYIPDEPAPAEPRPVQPTPAPESVRVLTAPAPTLEPLPAPMPRPAIAAVTPRPTPPGDRSAPPPLPMNEIFDPEKRTAALTPTTGSMSTDRLLGQRAFHWDQARSFLQRGYLEDALVELLYILRSAPTDLDARLELADTYDKLDRAQKALDEFQTALIDHPRSPRPWFRMGNFYLRRAMKGENPRYFDLSRNAFTKAIQVDPKYHFAYHNLGIIHVQRNEFDLARQAFETALGLQPEYASAHYNLGALYEQHLNDPKKALYHYRQYVGLGGENADEVKGWIEDLEARQ